MQRILVLRGGALGDFIVTLPALALLRHRWPTAVIELAGNATAAQLGRARGLLDTVHSQHERRWSTLYGTAALPRDFAEWLATFDLVINFWPDPDRELSNRFPRRAGQTFLFGSALPTSGPAAAHYCAPLRSLGLEPERLFYPLHPIGHGTGAPAVTRTGQNHFIAIHPGSGSPAKNWPAERWERIITELPAPVSVILGEAETERWNSLRIAGGQALSASPVAPHIAAESIRFLDQVPLEELVGHFASCRLFLGHDSGISHLAANCGVRCGLLFGPTDPAVWAPPVPNVQILKRESSLSSISLEDVRRWVTQALADQT